MNDLVSVLRQSYDDVPYVSHPFPQTAPEQLYTLAHLFGVEGEDPKVARVLEIGCSSGGNILPYALRNPKAHVVGVDLSEVQVSIGQKKVDELKLRNIVLKAINIEAFENRDEPYDYIICHGVFSWVPKSVQQAILKVCSEHLSKKGVVYISYNTYPGWKTKEIIRDAMMFRGSKRSTPQEKISYAMGMLDFIQETSAEGSTLRKAFDDHVAFIKQSSETYVLHEFLEPCNQPMYFKDFISMASEFDLGYLAEASYQQMFLSNYPDKIAGPLSKEITTQEELEQFLDFVNNNTFRQTLLIKKDRQKSVSYTLDRKRLENIAVAGFFSKQDQSTAHGVAKSTQAYFDWRGVEVVIDSPLDVAFMEILSDAYPDTLTLYQLYTSLEGSSAFVRLQNVSDVILDLLKKYIVCGYVRMRVQYETHKLQSLKELDELFKDEEYKWQWSQSSMQPYEEWAVTPWHDMFRLSDAQRELKRALSEQCTYDQLYDALRQAVVSGKLFLQQNGESIDIHSDKEKAAQVLDDVLKSNLLVMWRNGLLAVTKS